MYGRVKTGLLIGGSHNGQRLRTETEYGGLIDLPVLHKRSLCFTGPDTIALHKKFEIETYICEVIQCGKATFEFWRFTKMPREVAIEKLFEGYKP